MGLLLDRPGSFVESFRILMSVIRQDPGREKAAFALVGHYRRNNFDDVARERLEAVVKRFPGRARYHNELGLYYRNSDATFDRAVDQFNEAVVIEPGNSEYVLNLGRAMALLHRLPEAEKRLREGLRLSGNAPEARVSLASFLSSQAATPENLKESESLLRTSVKEGGGSDAAQALGSLLLQRGEAREAVLYLEQAIELSPNDEAFYLLGNAYRKLGNKERAEYCLNIFSRNKNLATELSETIEKTRLQKDNYVIRLKLARLYLKTGDFARSINQYQFYLHLKPNDEIVKKEYNVLVKKVEDSGEKFSLDTFTQMMQSARVGK
jgi:tetratricopeptide (TPR) repeat protein